MDSILRAQRLDALDSFNALFLYERLCNEYGKLKKSHYDHPMSMVDSFADEQYCDFITEFIDNNLDDLEKVWGFGFSEFLIRNLMDF